MKKLIILVFLVFVLISPFVFAEEAECMTREEVEAEGEACLYIYKNKVYSMAPYGGEHFQHDCGSEVTGIMRETHIENPEHYFGEAYRADLCGFYVSEELVNLLTYGLVGLAIVAISAVAFYFLKPHRK